MTIADTIIANNGTAMGTLNGDGITILDSTISDLVIDASTIGASGATPGNDGDGIRTANATHVAPVTASTAASVSARRGISRTRAIAESVRTARDGRARSPRGSTTSSRAVRLP